MTAGHPEPVDFKLLFERSPGLYLVLDPTLKIVAVSDAYCKATHISRDAVVGHNIFHVFTDDTSRDTADGVRNLRTSLDRVLALKRPDSMAIQRYDIQRPEPEGGGFEEKYWSPRNSPILDGNGNVRWIIHRVYDVTNAQLHPETEESQKKFEQNQKRLIIELRRMNEELAALDAMRLKVMNMDRMHTVAAMASALAHDVSQPLAAARNYLGVLKRDETVAASAKASEMLRNMEAQIDRAGGIVKDLKRFMSTGHVQRQSEKIAILVADAIRLVEASARLAGAAIESVIPPNLPDVRVNTVQIQQVLVNLLSNAIEERGGASPRKIVISAVGQGEEIAVKVEDNGPGLAPEISATLFDPFKSTKPDGLGVGLAICKGIVDDHGGVLKAERTGPSGTAFVFTLPVAEQPSRKRTGERPKHA